jgi:hypothetical protein
MMMSLMLRRSIAGCVLFAAVTSTGCSDDPAEPGEPPQFSGTYVGTYNGTGGCSAQTVSGGITFNIEQSGSTLAVTFTLNPAVEGLTIVGGQATIDTQTATSFSGTITQPALVSGAFIGELAAGGTGISGTVDGSAMVLCSGTPQAVTFEADYEGTRQ